MLDEELKKYWPRLEKEIKNLINSGTLPEIATEMIDYQFQTGGKRIRPLLALWAGEDYGKNLEDVFPLAASVELIHNASVVHDDIQDRDETRRGRPTAWSVFTAEQAINLGDILFILAFELLYTFQFTAEKKLELIKQTIGQVSVLISGQMLEFYLKKQQQYSEKDYITVAQKKTASLFALALAGTGVIADADKEDINDLTELGMKLGVLFQIRDDIIDFLGKKEGRDAGGDILEGKITLPAAHFFSTVQDEAIKKSITEILLKPREDTSDEQVDHVLNLFKEQGSEDFCINKYHETAEHVASNPVLSRRSLLKEKIDGLLQELSESVPR